jgi:pyruvate kinase
LVCDYPYLVEDVNVDQILIIDSGFLKVKVIEKKKNYILVESYNDYLIGSRRHINLPGVKLRLPGITDKDKEDILFAIKHDMNFIAASFMRSRANVLEIKELLKKNKAEHIQIISKIENQEALDNLEEIVMESDAVMIAR